MKIKRTNDELKACRPTLEEVSFIPKLPISILVENVRSVLNDGKFLKATNNFRKLTSRYNGIEICKEKIQEYIK